MIIELILPLLDKYGIIISFLAGFITGESIIIPLAFLSANDALPLWYIVIFSTLGMYLSDFIPFSIGKIKYFRDIWEKESTSKKAKIMEEKLQKYTKNNIFLTILYTKFIYGLSIPALIYLGSKKTKYSKFAFYNMLVEILFVPLLISIGWLSGKGFKSAKIIFRDVRIAIFLIIILAIVWILFRKWWSNRLTKLNAKTGKEIFGK